MRRKLLALMMLLGIGTISHAQDNYKLVMWLADGSKTDIELSQLPQVKFENDKVMVTSSVLDMEYDAEEVLRFTYERSTGEDAGLAEGIASVQDGRLLFHGVTAADQVSVYSANGTRVPVSIVSANGNHSLSLSSLPSGVYILKVNGKTSKFTKK